MAIKTRNSIIVFFINISMVVLFFICAIYLGIFVNSKRAIEFELKSRASSVVQSLILFRNWNAAFGGVYVEKTSGISSNPYLKNPDIKDKDGKVYTKKNPALMIREISETTKANSGFEFRIISLHPLNPNNSPDPFERQGLIKFSEGYDEFFTKEHTGNSTFYRYMVPLLVEESCLTCHDGYKVGDIRGGISIRFSIDNVQSALAKNLYATIALAVVTLGLLLFIIYRLTFRLYFRLKEAETKLQEISITDELTGLKNRRYLFERLHSEMKLAKRHQTPLSCLMFDLDHFKLLNDNFGHDVGDKVLSAIAAMAKNQCRESDVLCRYGGEEFTIILPNSPIDAAVQTAERLRQTINSCPVGVTEGNDLAITASFGVSWFNPVTPEEHDDLTALLKRADEALYQAKRNGRNRVEIIR